MPNTDRRALVTLARGVGDRDDVIGIRRGSVTLQLTTAEARKVSADLAYVVTVLDEEARS